MPFSILSKLLLTWVVQPWQHVIALRAAFKTLLCYLNSCHHILFCLSRKQNVFLSANHLVNQTNLLMKTVKDALN